MENIRRLLEQYFPGGDWQAIDLQGKGMNNVTRFVEHKGERYVLRIYETHRDQCKVNYEHDVLLKLKDLDKPFRTPIPVRTREGGTFVRTEDGKLAGLFHYLEGVNPPLQENSQLFQFGRVSAQLSRVLADVDVNAELTPIYKPYYEIEETHPRCSLEKVTKFCDKPAKEFSTAGVLQDLSTIGRRLDGFKNELTNLRHLPHQLVHGDLNATNVLADKEGRISAVLDFEFVTRDLRVMEPAVCLSDLIHPDREEGEMWARIDAFLAGYGSIASLSVREIESIPLLLLLRRMDVFIHFLGRYWDGVDSGVNVVEDQIRSAAAMIRWLAENEGKLRAILERRSPGINRFCGLSS